MIQCLKKKTGTSKGIGEYRMILLIGFFFGMLYLVMVPMGAADAVLPGGENFNVSNDSLDFDPSLPTFEPETVDLQNDNVEAVNITFVNISTINNPYSDLDSTVAATQENGTTQGILRFNFPETNQVKTWHTRYGFFYLGPTNKIFIGNQSNSEILNGIQTHDASGSNFITFEFNDEDAYLYQLQTQERAEPGFFDVVSVYAGEALSFIQGIGQVITNLPGFMYPVIVGLGLLVAYISIKVVTFL